MADEKIENISENRPETNNTSGRLNRRDLIKSLATVPVLGLFAFNFLKKKSSDDEKKNQILSELGLDHEEPAVPSSAERKSGDLIRLGIIGYGGRGEHLIRGLGFAHPDWIDAAKTGAAANPFDKSLEDFLAQEDLNVVLAGVCDVFDVKAERALAASANDIRPGGGTRTLQKAKRFRTYQEMLASPDIDAVIIATPDHWHASMIIEATARKKHVYTEKCMTRTEDETHRVYDAVKRSGIVFQLGHQNRQVESHIRAREIVRKNILGPITLVETTTNRNDPGGAWVYDIHPEGNEKTIDWTQFQIPAPHKVPFSKERFFRWRCWFDYGTGLSGDLLSHEFDAVNQILDLGIPKTAVASGGIYFFKDGRDVPDVFQVVLEYPDRNLTFVYSATLANGNYREKTFMGHDATMTVSGGLTVSADPESTRFKEKIEKGVIDTSLPIFSFQPGSKGIDAVTSATEKYFATRGLLYTFRGGKRVDTTHLHIKEWIDGIRSGKQPSCDIDQGFQEAITCHMATQAFLKGRRVTWDPNLKRIV
jgi:predicted dehydrogenase